MIFSIQWKVVADIRGVFLAYSKAPSSFLIIRSKNKELPNLRKKDQPRKTKILKRRAKILKDPRKGKLQSKPSQP